MFKYVFCEGAAAFGSTFLCDVAGDIVGAVGNIASSLINAHTQNKNTKRAIRAQQEENEKAYQRNVEMWERENDYNTPTAVAQRLRDAGMNPNLAYGTPNVSAPSPSAPITDMSGLANQRSPIGAALEQAMNTRYMNALINNVNAQTNKTNEEAKKTGAEYESQMTYNQYQEQILTGNLAEQKSRIELNFSQTDLNDMKSRESYTTIQNIMASTNKMKSELDEISARVENVKEDTVKKRIENAFLEPMLKAQMSHLYAQAKLAGITAAKTQEEFNQLAASSVYNLLTKKEQANNAFLQGLVLENTASELKVRIDQESFKLGKMRENELLGDIDRICHTYSNVIGSLTDTFSFGFKARNVWKF